MRLARHWIMSLVIVCVLAACSIPQESGIAQLTAEELNLRIPDEQADAFADGTISAEEVAAALSSFLACATENGADSLSASLSEDYEFQMTFEPEEREMVEDCRIVQFEATYLVFANQSKVAEFRNRDG